MLNKVILMGRLVRNPEQKSTQSGVSVANFTIAVDRDFVKGESGEKITDFIGCVAWRNTAEFVCKYFGKGRMIAVVGALTMREWTDKEGKKRRNTEVVADNVYFADSKQVGNAKTEDFDVLPDDDAELPF